MEKCTFSVQRITEAKDHAKDAGERVADGQLRTACQQTCPTDAIVFGDINDPRSRVSRFKNDPRAFRVLESLNTKPVISYLSKVRNRAPSGHGHAGAPGHAAGNAVGGSHSKTPAVEGAHHE
jgi:molybdopterin-containing oxidoreductase family iron-sulfur binding subunit